MMALSHFSCFAWKNAPILSRGEELLPLEGWGVGCMRSPPPRGWACTETHGTWRFRHPLPQPEEPQDMPPIEGWLPLVTNLDGRGCGGV